MKTIRKKSIKGNRSISRRNFIQTTLASVPAVFYIPDLSARSGNQGVDETAQLFWGELHTHTMLSDGNGTPEENIEIARSHLDFWAMADHAYDEVIFTRTSKLATKKDPQFLNDHWERVQNLCLSYEDTGHFIPILGYEWTSFRFGHHNVYYRDYNQPIRMPSTLPELYKALQNVEAIVIPHHTGYPVKMTGKDWDYFNESLSPFAEIYSLHGSSEEPKGIQPLLTGGSWMGPGESGGSIQEGLARGYKFGIMASSDSHAHHPGAYDLGLMGVHANDLSRKSLWEAFRKRRVFGVTGDRISLDFSINGSPMGNVAKSSRNRILNISAVAWDKIDRIDVIRNNILFHSFIEPSGNSVTSEKKRLRFTVEWGWENIQDHEWEGNLKINYGKILKAIRCFRGSVENCSSRGIKKLTDSTCHWNSKTSQIKYPIFLRLYADAIAFEVEYTENSTVDISLSCSGRTREIKLTPARIMERSGLYYMEDIPADNQSNYWGSMKNRAKFKIHQGHRTDNLSVNLTCVDDNPEHPDGHDDFYYIRLLQKNGQRAWSSPVWVMK